MAFQQRVYGDNRRAKGQHRIVGAGEVDDIGDEHGHPGSGADSPLAQGTGVGAGLLPQLRVGHGFSGQRHGRAVAEALCGFRDDGGN